MPTTFEAVRSPQPTKAFVARLLYDVWVDIDWSGQCNDEARVIHLLNAGEVN